MPKKKVLKRKGKKKGKKKKEYVYNYEPFQYQDPELTTPKVFVNIALASPNIDKLNMKVELPIDTRLEYIQKLIVANHKGAVADVWLLKDRNLLNQKLDLDKTLETCGLNVQSETNLYYDFKPVTHPVLFSFVYSFKQSLKGIHSAKEANFPQHLFNCIMSNVALPFLFKCNVTKGHLVNTIQPFFNEFKFATGSLKGELIMWKINEDHFDPTVLMVPSLNQNVGMTTCLTAVEMPEPELLACSSLCLLSVHADNRLRVWDVCDGRCISISSHDLFPNEQEIVKVKPLFSHKQRFVVCQGHSNTLYLCDVWKMRTVRELTHEKAGNFSSFHVRDDKELVAIDDRNRMYVWNISHLGRSELVLYERYVQNLSSANAMIKDTKEQLIHHQKLPEEVKFLQDISSDKSKVVNFLLLKNSNITIVLLNHKVVVFDLEELFKIEDVTKTQLKFLNIFINDAQEFKDIQPITLNQMEGFLILDKIGNVFYLSMQDIDAFWEILNENIGKEYHANNTDYNYLKLKDIAHAQINVQPIYLVNYLPQKKQSEDLNHDYLLERPEDNLISVDNMAKTLLYFDHTSLRFKFFTLSPDIEDNIESFSYTSSSEGKSAGLYNKFKRRRSSILETSFMQQEDNFRKDALRPSIVCPLHKPESKALFFQSLFHPFFAQSFGKNISTILNEGEEVVMTTIAFHRKVDPLYVFGTNRGRVLIFKIFFKEVDPNYYYYVINVDNTPINVMFNRKSLLFISSERGKIAVYSLTSSELFRANPEEEKINTPLVAVDITSTRKFETVFASPLKRILRIKLLDHYESSEHESTANLKDLGKSHKTMLGLILKNNSVVCFDTVKLKAEFECRCNENSVLGIFIHPVYEYLLILNANGNINIFSTFTGMFERSISIKEYAQALGVYDIISEYSKQFFDKNKYHVFKDDRSKHYPSPVHGVLEFNGRSHKSKLDYFGRAKNREMETRFEVINERLGDISRLNYTAHQSPHLVWLLHYCEESLFTTRYTRNGTLFLSLLLNETCHIMLTDPKFSPEDDERRRARTRDYRRAESGAERKENELVIKTDFIQKSKRKSIEQMELGFAFLSLIYPWGVDPDIEQNIKKIGGYHLPTFSFYHGIQGIGETFSFLVAEDQKTHDMSQSLSWKPEIQDFKHKAMPSTTNWQASEYLSTLHALSMMIYFVINSHLQSEPIITATMIKLVELLNKKCPTALPGFIEISSTYLSYFITSEDPDIVSSMSNLEVSALIQSSKERATNTIQRVYTYFRLSLSNPSVGKDIKLANIETVFLTLLSYWACFTRMGGPLLPEIMGFTIDKILRVIDIPHCLYHPYAVSASLKLLTDGISQYKNKYIKNIEDLFFNIIMIDFHYSASLDEQILTKMQAAEESSPAKGQQRPQQSTLKFKNLVVEIGKQPAEIRRLLQSSSSKAILSLGDNYRGEFVNFITVQAKNVALNIYYPSVAISIIRHYIKKFQKSAAMELPKLTEAILYCLDPNNPILRKSCQKAATHALQTMFKTFPFCSFNQASQKFAITARTHIIMIYDLRTAVCIKTLEGHTSAVSCLIFDHAGSHLASFSEGDQSLRVWKVSGFFSSVIGLGGKYKKIFEVPKNQIDREIASTGERKFRLEWNQNETILTLIVNGSLTLSYDMKK